MKNVAILCGGISPEHEISCISAGGVLSSIDRTRFNPLVIGITKSGQWVLMPLDFTYAINNGRLPVVPEGLLPVHLDESGFTVEGINLNIDVVFPVLHGEYGEDGKVQSYLDSLGISYVGSGALASSQAMDKAISKEIFTAHGIKCAPGISVTAEEWNSNPLAIKDSLHSLGLPLFVKSARGGSSRGTVRITTLDDLPAAMHEALTFDDKVLIESAVRGIEVECAILERGGEVFASTPGRVWIDPRFDFYDFEAKYLDGATRIDIPAPLDPQVLSEIRSKAAQAFSAIGCSGLARVDFFVTPTNEIIINEINTMPGMTPMSAYPKMMAASGISFTRVINYLLAAAQN